MAFTIDARLECGNLALTLFDAATGEQRLDWQGGLGGGHEMRSLFKQLMLLACSDQLNLIQQAQSSHFGGECIDCTICVEPETEGVMSTNHIVSFLKTDEMK